MPLCTLARVARGCNSPPKRHTVWYSRVVEDMLSLLSNLVHRQYSNWRRVRGTMRCNNSWYRSAAAAGGHAGGVGGNLRRLYLSRSLFSTLRGSPRSIVMSNACHSKEESYAKPECQDHYPSLRRHWTGGEPGYCTSVCRRRSGVTRLNAEQLHQDMS